MHNFTRNDFVAYRAQHKFHVGGLAGDLWEGQEIEFDGTVIRMDGSEHTIPALRGAVERGWLVPVDAQSRGYVPQASDVRVRPAVVSDPRSKPERNLTLTVSQDEQEVGSLKDFQNRKAASEDTTEGIRGLQARASSAEETGNVGINSVPVVTGTATGVGVNEVDVSTSPLKRGDITVVAEQEGRVVSSGGFSTSTKSTPVPGKDSVGDFEVKRHVSASTVDSNPTLQWEKGVPHMFRVVQRFGSGITDSYFEADECLEFDGWTLHYDGQEYGGPDAMKLRKAYEAGLISLDETDTLAHETSSVDVPENSILLPNGEFWDLSLHWKTRGKIAVEKYKDTPDVLEVIVAAETKGVVKMINGA